MKKQTFKSVWDAIENSEEEALNMKIRSELMSALIEELKSRKIPQVASAKLIGVTQPRVSDLFRGRVDLFSIDTLVNMLHGLGIQVKISTPKKVLRRAA
jgi:predicted XRE-type DNA-binding protein